ncbi:N-6 DNA methylase [Desulfovibrio fairfieldensis]|uniref:N-6 DNA methylase n=1 Tax=Desulfovibrio fairfieldensis TaxID=44742 RepID=UPI0009FAC3EE|nr:N-6 DNA methylase [Desulfovibrio fairfieldensis]
MDNTKFIREVANFPSGMTIMVSVEGQKGEDDFNKAVDSIVWEFAHLFREQGRIHQSPQYLMALLIIKWLNDLYRERRTELSTLRPIDNQPVSADAADDNVLSFPIAYTGKKIHQALNHLEQAFPDLLSGAFAQIDFKESLPGGSWDKAEEFIKTLNNCISAVRFTLSADNNKDCSTPLKLCRRILSRVDTFTGKNMEGFYTPVEISDLMAQLVKPTSEETFLDPVCGSGGFLLSAMDYAGSKSNAHQKLIGLEHNVFVRSLTQMSLFLCGARNGGVFQGGLFSEVPLSPNIKAGSVDVILTNPPFSQQLPPEIEYGLKRRGLLKYKAPRIRFADLAYIQAMLSTLHPDHGRMMMVVSMGSLVRLGAEQEIRSHLAEEGFIEAVIGLPDKLFYNTAIPVALISFRKNKKDKNVLFINASENFESIKRVNILSPAHINAIVDAYTKNENINGFSRVVELAEIVENEYDLSPSRYVPSVKKTESITDLSDVLKQKEQLLVAANDVEQDIGRLLAGLGYSFKET